MLPENFDKLISHIGSLGIDDNAHVILVPPGKHYYDVGWATRIYWTFKLLGHEQVSILNGGMAAWLQDAANLLQSGQVTAKPANFKAHWNKKILASAEDVKMANKNHVLLVDGRPEDQYAGINRHPRASESGTLPGALNLPTGWITVNNGGVFRNRSQLEQLYKLASVPTSGRQINFCNTGQLGSIGWFVSSEIFGNKDARLYAGSMVEWTLSKAGLVDQKIKLQ